MTGKMGAGRGKHSRQRALTDEQVIEARTTVGKGETCRTLAERFGVSYKTMRSALLGYTYQHLNATCKPQAGAP